MAKITEDMIERAAEAICDSRPHSGGGSLILYEDAQDFARAALSVTEETPDEMVERVAEGFYDWQTGTSGYFDTSLWRETWITGTKGVLDRARVTK